MTLALTGTVQSAAFAYDPVEALISGESVSKSKDAAKTWISLLDGAESARIRKTQNCVDLFLSELSLVSHKGIKALCLAMKEMKINKLNLHDIDFSRVQDSQQQWEKVVGHIFHMRQPIVTTIMSEELGPMNISEFALNMGLDIDKKSDASSNDGSDTGKENMVPLQTILHDKEMEELDIQINMLANGTSVMSINVKENYFEGNEVPTNKVYNIQELLTAETSKQLTLEMATQLWSTITSMPLEEDEVQVSDGLVSIDCSTIEAPSIFGIKSLNNLVKSKGESFFDFNHIDPATVVSQKNKWITLLKWMLNQGMDWSLFSFDLPEQSEKERPYVFQKLDTGTFLDFLENPKIRLPDQLCSGPSTFELSKHERLIKSIELYRSTFNSVEKLKREVESKKSKVIGLE